MHGDQLGFIFVTFQLAGFWVDTVLLNTFDPIVNVEGLFAALVMQCWLEAASAIEIKADKSNIVFFIR